MNRFDRVTSILLLLQTRNVVTAKYLADQFSVTERTIYRDIRTLENAGVPIGSEPGIGYFLEKGYRLPPVSFTLDEASALLLGEKLLVAGLDRDSLSDFGQALNKVRAVVDATDKDYLDKLDDDIEVLPTGSQFPIDLLFEERSKHDSQMGDAESLVSKTLLNAKPNTSEAGDRWLRECRSALVGRQVMEIDYLNPSYSRAVNRQIEPIGLFYYGWHWHLIGWCRLKTDYRDFRLDRVKNLKVMAQRYLRHSRLNLRQYLLAKLEKENLEAVEVLFGHETVSFVGEQRYQFGFIDEEAEELGVKMRFMTSVPEYMARWLLQFVDDVSVTQGESVRRLLGDYSARLTNHWN